MRKGLIAAIAAVLLVSSVAPAKAQTLGSTSAQSVGTPQLLDGMFQDHAVLQRDRPIAVYGRTGPGTTVTVGLAQARTTVTAGPDGRWRATLPPMTAGGPYVLTAIGEGSAAQTVSDVMIGDVWFCSGQSNMEFALQTAANAQIEVAGANDDQLRLFLVDRSSLPAAAVEPPTVGEWRTATPDSARDFSAACYFMGRGLRSSLSVPVGLISASWGGSIIEDWLSRQAMVRLGDYDDALNALDVYARDPKQGQDLWREVTQAWWRANDPGTKRGWNQPSLDDTDWTPIPGENFWETSVAGMETFDGIVWLRNTVELTAAQAQQGATLELGPVDDADITWVNGRNVGGQQGWDTPRTYAVPASALRVGRNVIAVGVMDTNGGGGAWGPSTNKRLVFADGTTVSLATGWRHRRAAPLVDLPDPPRTPWIGGSGTTTLYNGMIAPLGPYGLKGVAWYQGESNISDADGYRRLLPALFADWRSRFENADLRMLVVQLANFGPASSQPTNSDWAALRESQRVVVGADPLAGLAVAVDIGDRYDIHPTNKQEVGRRLALEALRLDGFPAAVSPQPLAVARGTDGIRIRYAVDAGLTLVGSDRTVGFELCDVNNSCRFVDARLVDRDVILTGAMAADVKVRFCWADSPVCNLYGRAGLPATPFEAPIR